MRESFKTNFIDGSENVMIINKEVKEIRYCIKTGNISVMVVKTVDDNAYTLEDLDGLSWQALKKIVEQKGAEWTNKADAIEYLIGKERL